MDDNLNFGSPEWFWALLLLLPLLWLFLDAGKRREKLLSRILAPRLQSQLAGRVSPLKRNLRIVLLLLSLVLIIVAMAKPRLGYLEQEIKSRGRDVILGIDTSRSMLSTDTAPTRLGRAKLISQDLLNFLKGDRVGLIAFAGNAFLQAPLTLDKSAVLTSIDDLDSNTIPKGGTDIASAIRMAIAAFGKGEGTSRALVLMTDGEDLEANALDAAKEASSAGIRIFTIGFGSAAGSLIPIRKESGQNDFVRDESGHPVNSKLDESRLTEIAKETGGFYQPFGQDAARIIYEKGIIPMEAQETGTLSARKPIERYVWPAAVALLLLALWSVLGEGRRGGNSTLLLMLACGLAFTPNSLRASGITDYRQGNYQGALKDFENRLESGSTSSEIRFDAGAAAYKAGDFKKAAGYFSEAMTSPKPKVREAATYNLANSLVRSGEAAQESEAKLSDWKNALQHYESVLKASPGNTQAKENYEIVKKLIEDLKKQQQQQKKDQKDKKDQNKDQKDKKDQDKKDKDQQKSDQSQGGGDGQKDSKEQKDQQQKNDQQKGGDDSKDQKQDSKDQQDKNQNQSKDSSKNNQQATPTPTPSPENGKGSDKQEKDQGADQQQKPDSQSGERQKPENQPQQKPGQSGQPTPAPSPSPKKEGTLGGGEQGGKQDGDKGEAAEAEEGKDGKMSASQARALLRSVQDEEQHVLQQEHRALEQTLRDW